MKINVMSGVRVVAEFPYVREWWYGNRTRRQVMERYERDLKTAVESFHDFMRDHRSQDTVSLSVESDYTEVCEYCNREWDNYFDVDENLPGCCEQARAEAIADKSIAQLRLHPVVAAGKGAS